MILPLFLSYSDERLLNDRGRGGGREELERLLIIALYKSYLTIQKKYFLIEVFR